MKATRQQGGVAKETFAQVPLVGQFFHSIGEADGQVEWQGVVIGNPEPGWYLLQLFEWVMGEPGVRRLVRIESMGGWLFYPDCDAMKFSYDHGSAREGGPYRKHVGPEHGPIRRDTSA